MEDLILEFHQSIYYTFMDVKSGYGMVVLEYTSSLLYLSRFLIQLSI